MKISRILSGISIFTHFEDADSAFQNSADRVGA